MKIFDNLKRTFCVEGDRPDYVLGYLRNKNVALFDVKFTEKGVIITIYSKDVLKLFAISDCLCYNIKEIGYKGKYAPLKFIFDRIGLFIGAAFVAAAVFITDGLISSLCYVADATDVKKEIQTAIDEEGLGEIFFYDEKISQNIQKRLQALPEVSFASVYKFGHKLVFDVRTGGEEVVPLNEKKQNVLSSVDGRVERMVVLSGTPAVNVGDEVKSGDILIRGEYEKDGEITPTYALGEVVVSCVYTYFYTAVGEENAVSARAKAIVLSHLEGMEIISVETACENSGGQINCVVTARYAVTVK